MLAIGVGETITDGHRIYILRRDLKFHLIGNGDDADHHVAKEVLEMLVKTNSNKD